MGPGMFNGIGEAIVVLLVLGVFGVWKLLEVAYWLIQHVRIVYE